MEVVVIAKLLAELAIFFIGAGYIGSVYGMSHVMYVPYVCMAAIGFLSWYINKATNALNKAAQTGLRIVPLLLVIPIYIWQLENTIDLICIVPPTIYLVMITVLNRFETNHNTYYKFMFKGAVMVLIPVAFSLLMPAKHTAASLTVPFAVSFCASSLVILRTLRHDKSTYQRFGFKAINLVMVLSAFVLALLVGNAQVQAWVLNFFALLVKLFTINRAEGDPEFTLPTQDLFTLEPTIDIGENIDPPGLLETPDIDITPKPSPTPLPEPREPLPGYVLIIIGIVIVLVVIAVMLTFKKSRRESDSMFKRSPLENADNKRRGSLSKRIKRIFAYSSNDRVRRQFARFVLHVKEHTGLIRPGHSIGRIIELAVMCGYDETCCNELKSIYLPVRYRIGYVASAHEAAEAKRLVNAIINAKTKTDEEENKRRFNGENKKA